jgi:hypothetical protein
MAEPFKEWDGGEWQEHVARLLRARYTEPGSYQEIPSKHGGDLGLEGFSREGICYQCYAAEPPFTIASLYEKQRDKITADIGKFIGNSKRLSDVFGVLRIKRWLLVVPYFYSAQLLEHCTAKKNEVLAERLPYVDPDFVVGVITDADFEVELCYLSSAGLYKHNIDVPDPASSQIQLFRDSNVALLTSITSKAGKLPKLETPKQVDEFTLRMIKNYLRGESAVNSLRTRDPEQFESLLRCKQAKEEELVVQSMVQFGGHDTLIKTFYEFRTEVQKHVSVSPHTADVIAWGAVGDWLLRCPLDF